MKNLERLGLGTMGMSRRNGDASIKTIHAALDAGMTLFNTGDFYNGGQSELVFGKAVQGIAPERYFLSVKFGALPAPEGHNYGLDMDPFHIKGYLTYSMTRLGLDHIHLYQPARMDTEIPIEEVMGVMADLVKAGYISHVGLSHVTAEELRRAHAVHPVHTVEMSYSLIDRSIEKDLIETARELKINVLVHGITANGLLRDHVLKNGPDPRNPLLVPENLEMVRKLEAIADGKGMTLSQLALAWSLAKYPHVQSIVGTSDPHHLQGFVDALQYELTPEDVAAIEQAMPEDKIVGKDTRIHLFTNGAWITK